MLQLTQQLAGEECRIFFPERRSELGDFWTFLSEAPELLALDTETSGLDVFAPGHELRLVQLGSAREAWVLRADLFADAIVKALRHPKRRFVAHNATFDLLVIDRHLGVKLEELAERTGDTRILAHLLDPRGRHEGGLGLGLKELSAVYVDDAAPDGERELVKLFRSIGETKATGWKAVPVDHPDFVRYAGLDVLLTSRLFAQLAPMVRDVGLSALSRFEHHLASLLAILQRRGMLVDVAYSEQLREDLKAEAERFRAIAARYGVENVNSGAQVADALDGMGEQLVERTPSGALKVDKGVLLPLADLDQSWSRLELRKPNPVADAVVRAKRAERWAESYAGAFLDLRDGDDRLHPWIGGLQARTARMSVSRPPLQQLPSSDWRVRRALIADPGQLVIASDYSQVEMRVLAALSRDETMIEAIASGVDLHDFTAERVFGEGFSKAQRKIAKAVGFGKVYGGGATTIQRQTGAELGAVKTALAAYDATFPGIKAYGRRLQKRAEYGKVEVVTPSGRHLPLDRDRLYSATNYVVQSTARDLLAQAIVDLFDAGLGDHLLLPIHDEILAQAPAADAADVVAEIGRVMERDFFDLRITSDSEVYGPSWGHGYGAPTERTA